MTKKMTYAEAIAELESGRGITTGMIDLLPGFDMDKWLDYCQRPTDFRKACEEIALNRFKENMQIQKHNRRLARNASY